MRSILLALLPVSALVAQEQHRHDLGQVHFPVSCTPAAQNAFDRGIALLHSFWYDEAEKTFLQAARIDPSCAMGHWGVAMSRYHPIWLPPTPGDLKQGAVAVEKARAAPAKTQRERDYIAAIGLFYKGWEKVGHAARALVWRDAMERLSKNYPDDREASILFALALLGTASPADKTYVSQSRRPTS
jgi:hypothetical protein